MTGEEPARPQPAARTAQFRVQDNSRTMAGTSASFSTSASTVAVPSAEELAAEVAAEAFDADATVAAPSLARSF
ncbi:MAG: hypothetical protein ACLGH0_05220, partial [Thermoanaerobaculia bacterium]